MSTELARYVPDVAQLMKLGEIIATSTMFGCQTPEEGAIVAWTCLSEQMSMLQFKKTYHVFNGTVTMRADAMLARFRAKGGRYEILERSPQRAAIRVTFEGKTSNWEITTEEADARELTKGKTGIKDNWKKHPAQMLWARLTSDMVHALCPEIVAGTYTPEDLGFLDVDCEVMDDSDDSEAWESSNAEPEMEPEPQQEAPPTTEQHAPKQRVDPEPFSQYDEPRLPASLPKVGGMAVSQLPRATVDFLKEHGKTRFADWYDEIMHAAVVKRSMRLTAEENCSNMKGQD